MKKNYSPSKKAEFYYDDRGYTVGCTVEKAAEYFEISTRRVRQMLIDGKLKGTKHGQSWRVDYPFQRTIGTRGPAIEKYRNQGIQPLKQRGKRWNTGKFNNQKIKKGD